MNNISAKKPLAGIASYMVKRGLLTEKKAEEAIFNAQKQKISFIIYLAQHKIVDTEKIGYLVAEHFGLPFFDLNAYNSDAVPEDLINKQLTNSPLIQKKYALPIFEQDKSLYVAVVDPTIPELHEIGFVTGLAVHYVIVEHSKLKKLIDYLAASRLSFVLSDLDKTVEMEVAQTARKEEADQLDSSQISDDAPIVRFINEILLDAIDRGASDIHFEPYAKKYRIRFRLDGVLYEITAPSVKLVNYFVARLKIMANLDISEHRIPQDGRFKCVLSGDRSIDFRVSTCPMLRGEKIVLRILNQFNRMLSIDELGMEDFQKKMVLDAIKSTQGIILVTGPTGSGKTVTLYTALNMLNIPDKNISTVEDPIEIELPGINQVQVNLATDLTFATALRAFLRQDPDIIMIGEIRDLETAEIAVKASHTGHLVLSTVHTNSAPETIVRLTNMGVKAFNISSSITLIIAQRLARRLCNNCKREIKVPKNVLLEQGFSDKETAGLKIYGPGSCDRCMKGYAGRIGIYEVMPISEELKRMIMLGKGAIDLEQQAKKEGLISLRKAGLLKVKQGITSMEEIDRVISQ